MSDFPKGGDIQATRQWLDKKGFKNEFVNWDADALLGLEKDDLLSMVAGKGKEKGLRLWGTLNTARAQAAQTAVAVKSLSMLVKLCIGDKVEDSIITFDSSKRPLDTVKEEISKLKLLKRGMSLDSFRLVTANNALVSDFASIEGQHWLIFHVPEKIIPLSGNEWTDLQLAQLKIDFEDVDLNTFFGDAGLLNFEMSERGVKLAKDLSDIDSSLDGKYTPEGVDVDTLLASAEAIRTDPLLQHPICKALFAAKKYQNHESFIDDFVKHLLNEMGFNEGSLYAAPQMRIKLFFGKTEKMATADVTIIDLLSYARIGVIEDKRWGEMAGGDSTPQLVAEGIAITQRNETVRGQKRPIDEVDSSETAYGIRVNGSLFYFYALQVSSEIRAALRTQTTATSRTTMYRYKSEDGLNFMDKKQRKEIILMLSLLQQVAKKQARLHPAEIPAWG